MIREKLWTESVNEVVCPAARTPARSGDDDNPEHLRATG